MDKLQRFIEYDIKENYERILLITASRTLSELETSIVELPPSLVNAGLIALIGETRKELCKINKNKDMTMVKTYFINDFKKIHKNLQMSLKSREDMEKCDYIFKKHYENDLSIWSAYTSTVCRVTTLVYNILYSYFVPVLYNFDYTSFDYFC